jgi:hypothetical protein
MSETIMGRGIKTGSPANQTAWANMNAQSIAAAIADFEVKVYGAGGGPLYSLVAAYGKIRCSNTLDNPFLSFAEIKETLGVGEVGYAYSEKFKQFTIALKTASGIVFANLLHDKDGAPQVDGQLILCRVMANRDFEQNGEVIIQKGKEFLKVLPESYLMKIH